MAETPVHYSRLRKQINLLVPPSIQAALTGVKHVSQDKTGAITLTYTDDTTETRQCDRDLCTEFSGLIEAIHYVQGGRDV